VRYPEILRSKYFWITVAIFIPFITICIMEGKNWDWLPVYGAIVATIVMFWNVYNIFRDRRSVIVYTKVAFPIIQDTLEDEHIIIQAINDGRRPIIITSVGFHLSSNNNLVYAASASYLKPISLPTKLEENESKAFYFLAKAMKDSLRNMDAVIEYAWVEDATNNRYKGEVNKSIIETFWYMPPSPK